MLPVLAWLLVGVSKVRDGVLLFDLFNSLQLLQLLLLILCFCFFLNSYKLLINVFYM